MILSRLTKAVSSSIGGLHNGHLSDIAGIKPATSHSLSRTLFMTSLSELRIHIRFSIVSIKGFCPVKAIHLRRVSFTRVDTKRPVLSLMTHKVFLYGLISLIRRICVNPLNNSMCVLIFVQCKRLMVNVLRSGRATMYMCVTVLLSFDSL